MAKKVYVAIDLKSFYASAECVARGLDPLHTNLVVADAARTEKTICLAVSPSLKGYGISGRARLFEVVQKVAAVNEQRQRAYPQHRLYAREYDDRLIRSDPSLALDYIVAPPRMAYYMEISTKIYQIYLRYVAPEDIHVYSIDEVFIDATNYLPLYGLNARGFARKLMAAVLQETGITATAGVGPNLFLCKVAMDVGAKHIKPDKNGARIAELDEQLAQLLSVSVQTIRLDRVTLGIPELRARTRTMAEDAQTKVRAIDKKDIVGELLDLELNKSGISTLKISPDMVLEKTGIARGYYMFAMANTLALAVVDAEKALTAVGNVKYKVPVSAGAVLVAKAEVTLKRIDKYYIFVTIKSNSEEVFRAKFIIVSMDKRAK